MLWDLSWRNSEKIKLHESMILFIWSEFVSSLRVVDQLGAVV